MIWFSDVLKYTAYMQYAGMASPVSDDANKHSKTLFFEHWNISYQRMTEIYIDQYTIGIKFPMLLRVMQSVSKEVVNLRGYEQQGFVCVCLGGGACERLIKLN